MPLLTSFLGGIIGAIATAIAVWLLGLFPVLFDLSLNSVTDSVLGRIQIKQYPGTAAGDKYIATCENSELLIGGSCTTGIPSGIVQGAMSSDRKTYTCTVAQNDANRSPVTVQAICLRR